MDRKELLNELTTLTNKHLDWISELEQLSETELNQKAAPESWSALECLEHLNCYGRFYLPELRQRIAAAPASSQTTFRPGVLGNYFAKSMQPSPGMKKMKTFSSMNPIGSALSKETIREFRQQTLELQQLLLNAHQTDLTKTKTAISISRWIRLRLGDTFRFFTYHIERHLLQAQRAAGIKK